MIKSELDLSMDLWASPAIDYNKIIREQLYPAVNEGAKRILILDQFGQIPSSGTAVAFTAQVVAIYTALAANVNRNLASLDTVPPETRFLRAVPRDCDTPKLSLKDQFKQLVREWRRDTMHLSRIDRKIEHPAYRNIISMGSSVVPYILWELENNGGYWFVALKEITHDDPTIELRNSSPKTMAEAWLAWGKKNGSIPRPTP